jgi:hypothetical protein
MRILRIRIPNTGLEYGFPKIIRHNTEKYVHAAKPMKQKILHEVSAYIFSFL